MDVFQLWEHVLNYVKEHDAQYLDMFTTQIFPVSFQGNVLVIAVTKPYLINWLKTMYEGKLKDIMARELHTQAEVVIQPVGAPSPAPAAPPAPAPHVSAPYETRTPAPAMVAETVEPFGAHEEAPFPEEEPTPAPFPPDLGPVYGSDISPAPEYPQMKTAAPPPMPIDIASLRPKSIQDVDLPTPQDVLGQQQPSLFPSQEGGQDSQQPAKNLESANCTFDNFVNGMPNKMAYEAAHAVAESVCAHSYNRQLNPLFIYGPPGLGKTHLLYAIQNYVNARAPKIKVLFKTSVMFMNELISSIKNQKTDEFRRTYNTVDVLLLDDVQFFGGRASTSFEWFTTFNILFEHQKYIIMTSDRTPEDIDKLEERLQSRFASGLVAPILPPDFEICCAILEKKSEQDGIRMPADVINFIASHINRNVRLLEGAYNVVKLHCEMMKIPITLDATKEALKNNPYIAKTHEITVDRIIDTVCQYYAVPRVKLLGTSRPKKIVIPRQVAMFLCRNELGESFPTLKDVFHKKDHTSIMYACSKVQKSIDEDPTFKQTIEHLRDLLKK